jgi:hypothetical protein
MDRAPRKQVLSYHVNGGIFVDKLAMSGDPILIV